ncbi:MAG TPA: CRTAC1 family protein [Vicinamibacteria bacterium]|nr:CRTAC1 family protein [Vicinamibacteria bacterium]
MRMMMISFLVALAFQPAGGRKRLYQPEDVDEPAWLEPRRQAQLRSAEDLDVFHDFQFVDRLRESGITFRNEVTEDSKRHYKAVHYDHGNGVAVADVDGDGLLDLYFTNQTGPNELWRNLGGGRFENITERAGVALADRISATASFGDIDNDGDADLYVTTVRFGNALFENDGKGVFADITEASGTGHTAHSSGAVFFDYDRDGLLDLFVCNVGVYTTDEIGPGGYYVGVLDAFAGHLKTERTERNILYHNLGGSRFEDVTARVALSDDTWAGDASPMDLNEDGWPDLYVLNMQGHDEYYENVEGKRFERRSRELFPKTPWGSMSLKAFDYDNDGDMDVMLTDMHSDMSEEVPPVREKRKSRMQWEEDFLRSEGNSIYGNAFFRNDGSGKFTEVSDALGVENYWPWGFSVGDLNADGFEDLFITASMNYPFRYQVNSLLLNESGVRFHDSEFILGVEPRREGRVTGLAFVLDAEGEDKDLALVEAYDLRGEVEVWGALGSRSSVLFDLDDDGDLDIVTNELNDNPMVLVSDLSERRDIRYLKVKLEGTTSNRSALGVRVVVSANGSTYTKVQDGTSGYLSHSLYPLYFGLGDAQRVDRVGVLWPSGKTQTLDGPIETNQLIEIREP